MTDVFVIEMNTMSTVTDISHILAFYGIRYGRHVVLDYPYLDSANESHFVRTCWVNQDQLLSKKVISLPATTNKIEIVCSEVLPK